MLELALCHSTPCSVKFLFSFFEGGRRVQDTAPHYTHCKLSYYKQEGKLSGNQSPLLILLCLQSLSLLNGQHSGSLCRCDGTGSIPTCFLLSWPQRWTCLKGSCPGLPEAVVEVSAPARGPFSELQPAIAEDLPHHWSPCKSLLSQ